MGTVNKLLPFIAIVFLLWMVFTIFSKIPDDSVNPRVSATSPQLAAIPQGFPREGKKDVPSFDPRFSKISPLTAFKVPTTHSFSAPMGTHTGMFTYNAQGYWEENPHRRGHHTGDDLNGIGGGNSDLGDPVYSVGDGLVVYVGDPGPGWGNTVIIAHRVKDGEGEKILQSLYAHLEKNMVTVDQYVSRGNVIGMLGTAGGQYLAHLHFEIREGVNLHIGPGYLRSPKTHLSPEEFLAPYLVRKEVFTPSLSAVKERNWEDLKMNNIELILPVLEK